MNINMHATIFLYLLLLLQIFIVCGDATINNNNNNLVNFLNLNLPYPSSKIPTGQDGQIYVFSEYNQTLPDRVTIATLSGNIARHSPKIYTIKSQNGKITNTSVDEDTTVFWLHDLKTHHNISFNYTYMHDINGLIRHFANNINGIVIYDPKSLSTNAALIRCAANDGLITAGSTSMISFLTEELKISVAANLSTSNPYHEFVISKKKLSNRGMVAQPNDGSKSYAMSAYAVFAKMPTVEHNTNDANAMKAFNAVISNFDNNDATLNAAFGWTSNDEHAFTASVTSSGGMVHASDFLYNLEVFSQLPPYVHSSIQTTTTTRSRAIPRELPSSPAKKHVHTVAFVFSDGDNLQILQNDWISSTHWNSKKRGIHNIGWSYSPAMAVLMPSLLAYAIRTSSPKDSLSSGPSGIGYAYPELFPEKNYKSSKIFAEATASLMKNSGMTLANVIGVVPSEESISELINQPEIEAIVYFTFGNASQGYAGLHGNIFYESNKPIIGLRKNLWGGDPSSKDKLEPKELVEELKLLPKDSTDPRSYSVVVNELGNGIDTILESIALMKEAGGFEIVLPEQLVTNVIQNTKSKQQCPLPKGPWGNQAGNLPKCWFPDDNSSCIMTCDTINILQIPVKCNLNVCSNIALGNDNMEFICVDTGKVCPSR